MINTKHLLKVSMVWVSIVYLVCFIGVALFPASRPGFMKWALHTEGALGADYSNVASFITGLIIWNLVVFLAVGLFAWLYNKMKR